MSFMMHWCCDTYIHKIGKKQLKKYVKHDEEESLRNAGMINDEFEKIAR